MLPRVFWFWLLIEARIEVLVGAEEGQWLDRYFRLNAQIGPEKKISVGRGVIRCMVFGLSYR